MKVGIFHLIPADAKVVKRTQDNQSWLDSSGVAVVAIKVGDETQFIQLETDAALIVRDQLNELFPLPKE